jgi:DNA-binding MarR family transcriptional regulator
MLVLWERGATLVKDLADLLQLDYGTLSPLLKRLQAAGLLERRRRTDDERLVQVTLTPVGQELKAHASSIPQQIVNSYGLTAQDFAALHATLVRLTDSVTASRDPTAADR